MLSSIYIVLLELAHGNDIISQQFIWNFIPVIQQAAANLA